jgi:hypothetical protein
MAASAARVVFLGSLRSCSHVPQFVPLDVVVAAAGGIPFRPVHDAELGGQQSFYAEVGHRIRCRSRRAADARRADEPSNMQWQSIEDAKAKDRVED